VVSESDLVAHPITLTYSDVMSSVPGLPGLPQPQLATPPPVTTVTALSNARVTAPTGPADWTPDNNASSVMYDPSYTVVRNVLSNPKTCQNKDLGHLAALFQIDCSSPVNKVVDWVSKVAMFAANGTAALIFYTASLLGYAGQNPLPRG
jgi:hypothetical protein